MDLDLWDPLVKMELRVIRAHREPLEQQDHLVSFKIVSIVFKEKLKTTVTTRNFINFHDKAVKEKP